jgi:chromosome segregation ATPase
MEFDELLITTGVDALVRLVKERQRIELEDVSSILNIPQETIEEWARVLEEEGILRIEYRLTRIYLVWVKPTAEEVATEKQSFYEEKKDIEGEVEQFRQRIGKEAAELSDLHDSFADFYTKAYAKIDQLEKTVSPLPASKTISEDVMAKYRGELSGMEGKLQEVKGGIDDVKREIASLGITKEASPSKELMDRIEAMEGEFGGLQQEMEELRKKSSSQEAAGADMSMPSVRDIKKKFETVQKDFVALRSRNAQMRQDMLSLHESSEILRSVAESIMGQEDKIGGLRSEVGSLSADADALLKKTNEVVAKVKQNSELVERLGDSVDVAKGVLKKFPSQENVLEEIEKLKSEEDALASKEEDLKKLLEAVGGRQVTAKQFAELTKKMDEKAFQLRKDMDALEAALQDEKSTYLTFQKIKERIVPAIDSYEEQLDSMQKKIESIRTESAAQMEGVMADAKKLQESLKGGQMQGVMKVAEDIRDKKKMLDEIRTTLEDLVTMSDNLNKRVTLLSREAKLLEIRTGGAPAAGGGEGGAGAGEGGEGGAPDEKTVRSKLELSREEEMEFRKKREELKKLIQRLWEE